MGDGEDLRRSLDRLVDLGRTPDVNIRPVLLRVLVDLFVRKKSHAPADVAQFEEIAHKLVDEADLETRRLLARKLALHPATPASLIARFQADAGPVAATVLEFGPMTAQALAEAAAWGTPDMAAAVARRSDLLPAAAEELANRPEAEVLLELARNAAAPIGVETFRYLVRRARTDEALALALLARGGDPLDLAPLFLLADGRQRTDIVLAALREDLGPETRRVRPTPEERDALVKVERAILAPGRDNFDAALAMALRISLEDAWRIMDDPRGEPLALALSAIGASPELAARVFILSAPAIGQSVTAVRMLTNLVESVPARTARRLVAAMVGVAAVARRAPAEADRAARSRDVVHQKEPALREHDDAVAPRRTAIAGG